jgi:hypothetical protein
MIIADENGSLKCRLRLDAQWDDDGTIDGYVTSQFHAITCWDNDEPWTDPTPVDDPAL